jgi:hypothetical protein
MNRLQFGLTLFLAGLGLAFAGSGLTTEREPAWDPREPRSALFTQQAGAAAVSDVAVNTKATLNRWVHPVSTENLGRASVTSGLMSGVLITLQLPPEKPLPFISVEPGINYSPICSSSSTPAATTCSVQSNQGGKCSADNTSPTQQCSAGAAGGSNAQSCSSLTSGLGTCSTLSNGSGPPECTTANTASSSGLTCSVSGGSSSNCTVGASQSGNTCSANGDSGGSHCSVTASTESTNQCSVNASSSNSSCSVTSGGTGAADFCSISKGQKGTCTVIGSGTGTGNKCSVIGTTGTCSVEGGMQGNSCTN